MDNTIEVRVSYHFTREDLVDCLALAAEYGVTPHASEKAVRRLLGFIARSPEAALRDAEALVTGLWPNLRG